MGKKIKKILVTAGIVSLMFIGLPSKGDTGFKDNPFTITAQAAEQQYSHRWETQADGSWKYKLDNGSYATSAWVQDEVDKQWYLLDDTGIMRSGIFESYGRYYLLSEEHDGHFGHLIKNGEVYRGITIQADTSAEYEGALSAETIESLKAGGVNFGAVSSVTGTKHVTNGQVDNGSENREKNQTDDYTHVDTGQDIDWSKYDPADMGGSTGYMGDHWY